MIFRNYRLLTLTTLPLVWGNGDIKHYGYGNYGNMVLNKVKIAERITNIGDTVIAVSQRHGSLTAVMYF